MSRILVTGASRGIGRALVEELDRRGHEVVAAARNVRDLDGLAAAQRLALDVTNQASVDAAVATVGDVDVVVNNAGVTVNAPLEAAPIDVARTVMETNVLGPLRMTQAVLPGMRERGQGLIANISSLGVYSAPPLQGLYTASKAALEKMSEVLRFEAQHFGVKVVVIPLGGVRTEMTTRQKTYSLPAYEPLVAQQAQRYEQYRRYGGGDPPEQVAAAIADILEQDDPPLRALDAVGAQTVDPAQARRMARQGWTGSHAHAHHPRPVPFKNHDRERGQLADRA